MTASDQTEQATKLMFNINALHLFTFIKRDLLYLGKKMGINCLRLIPFLIPTLTK